MARKSRGPPSQGAGPRRKVKSHSVTARHSIDGHKSNVGLLDMPVEVLAEIAKYCVYENIDVQAADYAHLAIKSGLIDKNTAVIFRSAKEVIPEAQAIARASKQLRSVYPSIQNVDWDTVYFPTPSDVHLPLPKHIKRQLKTILLTPLLHVGYKPAQDVETDDAESDSDEKFFYGPPMIPCIRRLVYNADQLDNHMYNFTMIGDEIKKNANLIYRVNVDQSEFYDYAGGSGDPLAYLERIVSDFPRYKKLGFHNLSINHIEREPYINKVGNIVEGKVEIDATFDDQKLHEEILLKIDDGFVSDFDDNDDDNFDTNDEGSEEDE